MKTLTKLMVLVVSLGLIGSVAMASPNPEKITGTVTAVDTAAKTLTVKADQSGLSTSSRWMRTPLSRRATRKSHWLK